ncbi:MAG: DUF3187 family protein [Gemmatimonadales bacterium]|nr:DUF3187 family protein [Gemmatimonadales bacterium]
MIGRPLLPLLLSGVVVAPAPAQGLPGYGPINPMAASRSGLEFQPYVVPSPGWQVELSLEYANSIELNILVEDTVYLLDSELLRLGLRVTKDLGPRTFVFARGTMNGSYDGFLDGFVGWYHNLFSIDVPERDVSPTNTFRYELGFPDGSQFTRSKSAGFLGDVRLGLGWRHARHHQTVVSVTLPTSTGPRGYGRGTWSGSVTHTVWGRLAPSLTFEATGGLGHTPSTDDLERYQRTWFGMLTTGARWRFWGRQSLYANLLIHSAYYRDTRLPALDRKDTSLDFGWILETSGGREWRIGMVEDLEPSGPAIDLVLRFGARF